MMKDASITSTHSSQAIYQTVTAVALGIFTVSYASFKGKSKFFCDSLTFGHCIQNKSIQSCEDLVL